MSYDPTRECLKCGTARRSEKTGKCLVCAVVNQAAYRARVRKISGEKIPTYERRRERERERWKNDPLFKLKSNTRRTTRLQIKYGNITPEPCEVCGDGKVEPHHDDYTNPMNVRWLCAAHHRAHHKREKEQRASE